MSRDTVFSMRNDCPGNSDQQDWDLILKAEKSRNPVILAIVTWGSP